MSQKQELLFCCYSGHSSFCSAVLSCTVVLPAVLNMSIGQIVLWRLQEGLHALASSNIELELRTQQ